MKSDEQMKRYARMMRHAPTPSEKTLAGILKADTVPFLQQVVMGFWILDFVIPSKMCVIEVDGEDHNVQEKQFSDSRRDTFLRDLGFLVLRVRNDEVEDFPTSLVLDLPDIPGKVFREACDLARQARRTNTHKGSFRRGKGKSST